MPLKSTLGSDNVRPRATFANFAILLFAFILAIVGIWQGYRMVQGNKPTVASDQRHERAGRCRVEIGLEPYSWNRIPRRQHA